MTEPVFRISPAGVLTVVHAFRYTDGSWSDAGLVSGNDGRLYGTPSPAAASTFTVPSFRSSHPSRSKRPVSCRRFTPSQDPTARVLRVQLSWGLAETSTGRRHLAEPDGHGTVFKLTKAGVLTTLHSFTGSDGSQSRARLLLASDGNFYGTTYYGGVGFPGVPGYAVHLHRCTPSRSVFPFLCQFLTATSATSSGDAAGSGPVAA